MKLKLTKWGEFVNRYGVANHPDYWTALREEIRKMQEADEDVEFVIGERFEGMRELMEAMMRGEIE